MSFRSRSRCLYGSFAALSFLDIGPWTSHVWWLVLDPQTRALHAYLRWRNDNARHLDVLAAQRRERARVRSEKDIRWGGRPVAAAA
ncbi:hypothetical protein SY2F82_74740 [Streptomyces sp. Y2F8-2]|nr:hypothetical protein SY2F82_74740 [Streptomyces sp. Y2F8-2]